MFKKSLEGYGRVLKSSENNCFAAPPPPVNDFDPERKLEIQKICSEGKDLTSTLGFETEPPAPQHAKNSDVKGFIF